MMYNNQYMNPYRPTTQSNNIVWVQGIEGAKAYQIPSSSSVMLMDSENDDIFYIKISDNIGMCTLRTFRYEEIVDAEYIKNLMLDAKMEYTNAVQLKLCLEAVDYDLDYVMCNQPEI